jgi:hypothetical protein
MKASRGYHTLRRLFIFSKPQNRVFTYERRLEMKKYAFFPLIMILFIGFFAFQTVANAAENLEDWTFFVWQGNITMTPSGTVVNVQTPGSDSEEWSRLSKKFPNALGIKATVNISSINGNGWSSIGIRKNVGINTAGNRILAEIYLSEEDGDKGISFKIRERDDQGNTLRVIVTGHPGDWSGTWSLGQNVEIGLARISDYEICFYTPANGALIIVKLSEKMNDFDSDVQIFASTADGSNKAYTGTVSNVDIIYSNKLMVFKDALPQKSVVVVPLN